jgi:hypothetical protein
MALLSAGTVTLFANTIESPLFYETLRIVKVYVMQEGYRAVYLDPDGVAHDAYIPMSWFAPQTHKAFLITGQDPAYPYMAIYYLNGKFDYVKLYVQSSYNDPSWGILPPSFDPKGKFPTNGTLTIKWQ